VTDGVGGGETHHGERAAGADIGAGEAMYNVTLKRRYFDVKVQHPLTSCLMMWHFLHQRSL
jgi:hypothetical protein